ncbi:MAG: hypothetical protein ACWGQW_12190 [bacterium]
MTGWPENYVPLVTEIGPITPQREWLSEKIINEPMPGLFKKRLRSKGPWVPAKIWLVEERDPETNEIVSDVSVFCQWSPGLKSKRWYNLNPWNAWANLYPIDEDEFRWLMTLKEL